MAVSEKSVASDKIFAVESPGPGDPEAVFVEDVEITASTGFDRSTNGEHADAIFNFTDAPADRTTVTLEDSSGTSITFEVDAAGSGVTSPNVALDGIVAAGGGATGMAADWAAKINAQSFNITATDQGSGEIHIEQDSPGADGNTTITYSDASEWDDNVSEYQAARAFSGGLHYPSPGEVIGMGVARMGYHRISYDHPDLRSPSTPRSTTITIDETADFPFPNKLNANDIAIIAVWVRVADQFVAPSISHLHITIGTDAGSGDPDAFITSYDIYNLSSPPYAGLSGDNVGVELTALGYLHRPENGERITVSFAMQGDDLANLTAGNLDIFVRFFDLWERNN